MSPELQEKIFALKPEWFKDLPYGVECGDGWFDVISELVTKLLALEAEEPDNFTHFKVLQIKQKLGGLRFYVDCRMLEHTYKINTLITSYEHKSFNVCELCGKDAKVRTLGYVITLCRYPHDDRQAT
jgi:hypothetical protein